MTQRTSLRLWFATIALALLAAIAVHGLGARPSFLAEREGSAFNAYSSDVAIVAPRSDLAKQNAAQPTPVPPLAAMHSGFHPPGEILHPGTQRTLPQSRAPPLSESRSSQSLPRAPPIA